MPHSINSGVFTTAAAANRLTDRKTAWSGAKVRLYKSSFVPTQNSVLADFDAAQCDFVGYAEAGVSFALQGVDADGGAVCPGSQVLMLCADDTKPQEVGGMYLILPGPPVKLIEHFPFNPAVAMNIAGAYTQVTTSLREPGPDTAVVES